MKYDVFISARSNDYGIAEDVCNFLKENGLKVFFSKRSVFGKGKSRFLKAITEAIRDSDNLIVVCSNANYVYEDRNEESSRWVYHEWSAFLQSMLNKEKSTNADIVTIYTSDVDKKDLPFELRNRQCIPYEDYKNLILSYLVDDPSSNEENNEDNEIRVVPVDEKLSNNRKTSSLKHLRLPLLTSVLGLLLGLGLYFLGYHLGYVQNKQPLVLMPDTTGNQKTLVLAGGGSVVTYLDHALHDKYDMDSMLNLFEDNKYPNAFYLHVPSGSALTLLAEEAIMRYSIENQPFYPVCLSAEKAVDTMFTTKCSPDLLLEVGHIVEYKLGEEQLAVYVENKASQLNSIVDAKANKITVKELVDLLKSDVCNLFSTSKESGTYDAFYKSLIKEKFDLSKAFFYKFSNQSDLDWLQKPDSQKQKKPFVLLGGECYRPKILDNLINNSVRQLLLVDNQNRPIMRPLYIYFLAYKYNDGKVEKCIIPGEVFDLLKFLGFKKHKYVDEANRQLIIEESDSLIISISDD